jgi:hypothetical protein
LEYFQHVSLFHLYTLVKLVWYPCSHVLLCISANLWWSCRSLKVLQLSIPESKNFSFSKVNWAKVRILVLIGSSKFSDHVIFSIYSYYEILKLLNIQQRCQSQQWDHACVIWHLALWENPRNWGKGLRTRRPEKQQWSRFPRWLCVSQM